MCKHRLKDKHPTRIGFEPSSSGFLSDKLLWKLESFQVSPIKRSLGLKKSKFIHHSKLQEALNIQKVSDAINNITISLWKRIFNGDSPVGEIHVCVFCQNMC